MSKKRILLVRHGKTEWNGLSRFQGKTDVPLDEEGRRQARCLAMRLEQLSPFPVVFSSSLSRAEETARIILSGRSGTDVSINEGLSEMRFGAWEGHSIHEIESRDPESFRKWKESPFEYLPPGAEPFPSLESRVRLALDAVSSAGQEQILVVTHGGIVRAALAILLSLPLASVWRMKISNCSVTGIDVGKRGASLAFLNDDLHTLVDPSEAPKLPFPV